MESSDESEESRILCGPFLESLLLVLLAHRSLGRVAFRGLAPEGPREVDSISIPDS